MSQQNQFEEEFHEGPQPKNNTYHDGYREQPSVSYAASVPPAQPVYPSQPAQQQIPIVVLGQMGLPTQITPTPMQPYYYLPPQQTPVLLMGQQVASPAPVQERRGGTFGRIFLALASIFMLFIFYIFAISLYTSYYYSIAHIGLFAVFMAFVFTVVVLAVNYLAFRSSRK